MIRARFALAVPIRSRGWRRSGSRSSPRHPREYDVEITVGDRIAMGPYGAWELTVTGRRLGPDGVLILECDLNRDRTSGSKNTVAVVLQSGWMPDVIAAFPPFLRDFVPTDETIADPVELTRQIAAKLLTVA